MSAVEPPRFAEGPLVLADIGGYTSFLTAVTDAHADDAFADGNIPAAFAMMSSLLDGIVGSLVPPFTLAKLEGDAVFAYATDPAAIPRGGDVLACIGACHAEFRRRLAAAHEVWTCGCGACLRIDSLELKFIVHAGRFVLHAVAGATELAGSEVVMAHRLLKTDAAAASYTLITSAAAGLLAIPIDDAVRLEVRVEHYPPVEAWVFPIRRT